MLERLNEEIRRGSHVVRIFPIQTPAAASFERWPSRPHKNWLEAHRHLNMNDLKEHKKTQLRQAA